MITKNLSVSAFTMFLAVEMISLIVNACNSTYSTADEVLSKVAEFEFNKKEREQGLQTVFAELSSLLVYKPIQFTVADFYVISKPFLASVKLFYCGE